MARRPGRAPLVDPRNRGGTPRAAVATGPVRGRAKWVGPARRAGAGCLRREYLGQEEGAVRALKGAFGGAPERGLEVQGPVSMICSTRVARSGGSGCPSRSSHSTLSPRARRRATGHLEIRAYTPWLDAPKWRDVTQRACTRTGPTSIGGSRARVMGGHLSRAGRVSPLAKAGEQEKSEGQGPPGLPGRGSRIRG